MTGGRNQVRFQWKRGAVIGAVVLLVCSAVYLNWQYAGETADEAQNNVQQEGDGVTTRVLGDAVLVGGEIVDAEDTPSPVSSYFDTARLSRQQSRDNALSLLREAAEQENVDQAALDDANRAIQTLAGYTMLETQIENLVIAKGYADCVVFMSDNSISIVVSAAEDGLQIEDVAKITDIVLSETTYSADQIKILEAN